jgi:hypothetical protein
MTAYVILADEMDQADDELRETIRNIWPLQAKKMLDLLIPRKEGVYHYIFSVCVLFVQAGYVALCLYTSLCCAFGHSQHPDPRNMKYRDVYHLPTYTGLCMEVIQQVYWNWKGILTFV